MKLENILIKSIKDAQRFMQISKDPAHNTGHVKSVTSTALEICNKVGYKNTVVIKTICNWHDVGRLISPIHEELSAQIAKYNLIGYNCDKDVVEIVYQGIRFHKWEMKPKTIEGDILRDADKLDFISIKRWKTCIQNNRLEHIIPMIKLIPRLRENLKLDASKQIYDVQIKKFKRYIRTDKDLKNTILFSMLTDFIT